MAQIEEPGEPHPSQEAQGKPRTDALRAANRTKSKIRATVERVFAQEKAHMGLFIRTIGIRRSPVFDAPQSRTMRLPCQIKWSMEVSPRLSLLCNGQTRSHAHPTKAI
jgi:hypothetical protein